MRALHAWGWVLFLVGGIKVFWMEYQLSVLHTTNLYNAIITLLLFVCAIFIIGSEK